MPPGGNLLQKFVEWVVKKTITNEGWVIMQRFKGF